MEYYTTRNILIAITHRAFSKKNDEKTKEKKK